MKFRHCRPKIALALPLLGALITPTSAIPIAKNLFRADKNPLPSEVIREKANHPPIHYDEVPVEPKEGTAVPEPALVPNQPADDEVVDSVYDEDEEVQPLHDVAITNEDPFNSSENAKAEREPYEVEDISPVEKRGVFPSLTGDDEFPQLVQSAPSTAEEEEPEAGAELENLAVEEEESNYIQENGEKQVAVIAESVDALKHSSEDWQRSQESIQNEVLEEDWENSPHRRHVAEPIPTAKPHEPIPDHFDGHVDVPITPDSATTAEDVHDVDIDPYLLNRFEIVPTIIGDTLHYAVPADLLPEALLDAEEEDPEEYLERRTIHHLTALDIKADEPTPEAGAAEAEARTSPTQIVFPASPTCATPTGHTGIPRPVIQN